MWLVLPGVSGSAEGVDDDEREYELHAELSAGAARPAGSLGVGVHPDHRVVRLALQGGGASTYDICNKVFNEEGRSAEFDRWQ